jgi:hypothetical protein
VSQYNVTLDSKENTMKLLNGVEIDGKDYDCSLVFSNNTVVSSTAFTTEIALILSVDI